MRSADEYEVPGVPGALWSPTRFWRAPIPLAEVVDNATGGDPTPAYISNGRWVVGCPDCFSAQHACLDDLRFMCAECANVMNGHLFRPVVIPAPATQDAVETALEVRPPRNQNWLPHETVEFLLVENVENNLLPAEGAV